MKSLLNTTGHAMMNYRNTELFNNYFLITPSNYSLFRQRLLMVRFFSQEKDFHGLTFNSEFARQIAHASVLCLLFQIFSCGGTLVNMETQMGFLKGQKHQKDFQSSISVHCLPWGRSQTTFTDFWPFLPPSPPG